MKTVIKEISVANPNRDGTGTLVNLITGAANGTTVNGMTITSSGPTTDGMIRFFLYDGTLTRLVSETSVYATTPSSTARAFSAAGLGGVYLEQNQILKASTEKAETFSLIINYTDQ